MSGQNFDFINPIIQINSGKIRGKLNEDVRGGKFYSFLGIPYAKPPIGDLRFKAPIPVDPWLGIFEALEPGNVSIQPNYLTKQIDGSEDCLNLNVHTPCLPNLHAPKTSLKPVMVFVHGGSFLTGSNHKDLHGPEILISENVVIVEINYRLGILGFLNLEDPKLEVPGNASFKDMVLSLKWIQKNIKNFNGDPENVTIFGNSAGAASVHFLVLSPMAKGLFHKALCQSGSALSSWAYAFQSNQPMAKALGLGEVSDEELYRYLKEASVEEIFKAQTMIDEETVKCNRARLVGAVVEPQTYKGEKFFKEHPVKLLLSGRYTSVPLLMGYNSGDGMIVDGMVAPEMNYIYWTDKEHNVPGLLNLPKGSLLSKQLGEEIVKFYFGKGPYSRETHLKQFYDITTDNSFLRGIFSSIKHHRRTSNAPIYMYRLSLESDLCFYKNIIQIELPGVCHVDEMGYLFTTLFTETPSKGTIEDITQRKMCRMWANFARYGNPTPFKDALLGIIWEPVVNPNKVAFLDIGDCLKIEYNPEEERMTFWDRIYSSGKLESKL
ncbi:unnamed protein product [Ceutorhynchus assimilis]|uniref:Carboxylesterase type B domain-containing protein n=1 Tax=Ceutorhynchus assimilis TaxID=467358 RepID=A0A9N9MGI3_9CUCU|nr:unnamed protein product [Ceutorhynchus assimilis]